MATRPPTWLQSERFIPSRFVRPALRFTQVEAASGIVLAGAAIVALVIANSPWGGAYEAFWQSEVVLDAGILTLEKTLRAIVNDGLMALFFFVVGLEIKRELVEGELRRPADAALPAIAALGGMLLPALVYLAFNAGGAGARGWGIPMATDIAFSLGVLALLGSRIPVAAKLFLLAVAVVDDIGVIAVIAIFYTEELSVGWLLAALVGLLTVVSAARVRIRAIPFYVLSGAFVWLAVLESGVHATLAGVALGLLTPTRALLGEDAYIEEVERLGRQLAADRNTSLSHERITSDASTLAALSRHAVSPLHRLEEAMHPWTSFVVIPVFALANANVRLVGIDLSAVALDPIALGVAAGLVVGKTVGISGATLGAIALGVGRLPPGLTRRHIFGVAGLAGIGFTVSLFVTGLAFADPAAADSAKVGIFAGSLVAGLIGVAILRTGPAVSE